MTFDLHSEANLHNFYDAISPWESGYQNNSFAYVAVRRFNEFVLAQGILWLHPSPSQIPFMTFESENVRGGHFKLSEVDKTFRDLIKDLGNGRIDTPHGQLLFPFALPGHKASFTPLHPSALQSQSRVNVLKLTGDKQPLANGSSVLDWELRSSAVPFDSIQELLQEYGLGGLFADSITVEVVASAVMGFDGDESRVTGEKARIVIRLANTLDTNSASVGYRESIRGKLSGEY